jgi:hypothetical protein
MAAGIGHLQAITLRGLLSGLDFQSHAMALGVEFAEGTLIDGKCRIDEISSIFAEPLGAVKCAGGLFAAGQCQLDRPPRPVSLCAEANQRIDPNRRLRLVVERSAGVEKTILLDEREGIPSPVLALRFHHIDMRQQQNGFEFRIRAAIDRDLAAFLRTIRRGEYLHIAFRNSGGLQARRHTLRRQRAVAGGQRRVGLDELFIEVAKGRFAVLRLRAGVHAQHEQDNCGDPGKNFVHKLLSCATC